jgi:hypothetical protein
MKTNRVQKFRETARDGRVHQLSDENVRTWVVKQWLYRKN